MNELKKLELFSDGKIPTIAFGTGVVRPYSRNVLLFAKNYVRPILSSIRHFNLSRKFRNDFCMRNIVNQAYSCGFRMFDTGRIYGYSEKNIGEALRKYRREDLFLISKVSDMDLYRKYSPDTVEGNLMVSLEYLQTSYLDAYLLHWPDGNWIDIYKQMEKVYRKGLVRSIGVCNFKMEHFRQLEKECDVKPAFCQLELHPLNSKREIREYCKKNGIVVMAHTPTGRMSKVMRAEKVLQNLAQKYGKSIAQIILRWHYQNGVIPVVATNSKKHMEENLDIFDFFITECDMEAIEAIDRQYVVLNSTGIDDPNFIYNL